MWSPKTIKGDKHSQSYDNMLLLHRNDVVFSYFKSAIGAVGVVTDEAIGSSKPDFGNVGQHWSEDGWEVLVNYEPLKQPVDPRLLLDLFNQSHGSHAPMNEQGRVNQAYLFSLTEPFGNALLRICGVEILDRLRTPSIENQAVDLVRDEQELLVEEGFTRTERRQLALARIGQGLFKKRVAEIEPSCRLTGLALQKHLIASHIKPWRDSTGTERLDGANGLLLSPHVDHLFDGGFLSFTDRGDVLWSHQTPKEVVTRWHLTDPIRPRPFASVQRPYLEYHRNVVFQT